MAYTIVNGTNGNNNLSFTGISGFYNQTLINPYSGYSVTITGTKNVNNGIYDGLAGNDTLLMTTQGDVLTLVDASGTIMVKNIEAITAGDGGDIVIMSHANVTYGNIVIRGSEGDDILWANVGSDSLLGGLGNDIMDGGPGDDRVFGDEGNDYLSGGLGSDSLFGGEGNDILGYYADGVWSGGYTLASLGSSAGFAPLVNLDGKNRSYDTFNGDATSSLTAPTPGTDRLIMTSGNDVLVLSDTLSPVNNTLFLPRASYIEIYEAGAGDDVVDLSGGTHIATTIYGGAGNDALAGSTGNDTIYGEADDDLISGGGGNDALYGGAGNDAYYYKLGDGSDTVTEQSGNDSIHFGPGITLSSISLAVDGNDVLISMGADTIRVQNHFAADLSGRVETIIFNDGSTFDLASYGLNDAPIANDDDFTGDEDTVLSGNVLGNDTDPDGDTLTVTAASFTTALGGSVILNADGSFTYQGAANFHGNDSFTYQISDPDGATSSATVNLSIASVNDAPAAQDDQFSGSEDTEITGNVLSNDSDVDGDNLTVQAGTYATAQGGTVTLAADGGFSYTGGANFNGTDSFEYTLLDGNGGTGTATVGLTINAVNDAPTAVNDAFSGNEDVEITGNVLFNDSDVDGDVLSVSPGTYTTAQGGIVSITNDGYFSYQGAQNFYGVDSFEYTVTDGTGTSTGQVNLTIGEVNDAPVANDDSYDGSEDAPVTGNVLDNDTDADGDTLAVVAETITTAQGGSVVINADGSFSYQGAANFNGTDSFNYALSDGRGGSSTGSVTLNLAAINDAPLASDDSFSGNEDAAITGNVLSNDFDVDGDALSVDVQTLTTAQGGSVTINADGTFSYLGASNFNGSDSFSYTVRDASGIASSANVLIAVGAVNDAPVANDDAFAGFRNQTIEGNVLSNDSDVDGDTLSVQAGTYTTVMGGTIALNADGTFAYTPTANFYGEDSFDYTVLDGEGGTDLGTVSFTVDLDPSQSIIGTEDGETIIGTNGDDQIFGLDGDDTLYGDDGILTGITMDKTFADTVIMPQLKEGVNISNLRPKGDPALGINDGNLTVDYDATASVTFRKGYAGYDNSFGVFGIATDGTIKNASMEFANVKTAGLNVSHDIDLPVGTDGGAFGFFIIANGNNTNNGYTGLNITGDGVLSFVYNYGKADQRAAKITDSGSKVSIVYSDGVTTKVLKGEAYFTTERSDATGINKDGKVHIVSGLMDTNNKYLDVKTSDLASKPSSFTKNDYTITASSGQLIGNNNRIGIKSAASGGDIIAGNEALVIALAQGASKLTVSLSDIAGGNTGLDFKIFLNGSTSPVTYEYVTGSVSGGKIDIVLNADDFGGGIITKIELSSVSNSSQGTESFWLDNLYAEIPGGTDTNTLRIGFEDLYNTGDADYEDVLFDLDIKPVTIGDVGGGDDFLDGGAGNDTLYGEGGNDILVLGLGLDRAYGGEGADTFAITLIDQFVDRIEDFNLAQGDKINIADVLDSYDALTDDIAAFVRLVQVGSDTELQINADGAGDDYMAAALIIGGTDGADLAALVASGSLIATQSAVA